MSHKRILSIFFTFSFLLFAICDDKSQTRPISDVTIPINIAETFEIWMTVSYDYSWDLVKDGERDKGSDYETVNDLVEFILFDNRTMKYYYYNDENGYECFDDSETPYWISENKLWGENFYVFPDHPNPSNTGQPNPSDILFNGDTCYITSNEILETGYRQTKITLIRYTGTFPPADWPEFGCLDSSNHKLLGKFFVKDFMK